MSINIGIVKKVANSELVKQVAKFTEGVSTGDGVTIDVQKQESGFVIDVKRQQEILERAQKIQAETNNQIAPVTDAATDRAIALMLFSGIHYYMTQLKSPKAAAHLLCNLPRNMIAAYAPYLEQGQTLRSGDSIHEMKMIYNTQSYRDPNYFQDICDFEKAYNECILNDKG